MSMPEALADLPGLEKLEADTFAGIYFLCSSGRVLYVGQSVCLPARIREHKAKGHEQVFFVRCALGDLDRLERHYIEKFEPPMNRNHRPSRMLQRFREREMAASLF